MIMLRSWFLATTRRRHHANRRRSEQAFHEKVQFSYGTGLAQLSVQPGRFASRHRVLQSKGDPMAENHTIRLLTEMRAEIQTGMKDMRSEMKDMQEGIEANRRRITESQTRLSTEILAVAGAVQETKGLIMQQSAIKAIVDDHEQRINKLERE